MEPYCFVFRVEPDQTIHRPPGGKSKIALVFALFEAQDEAEQQAIQLLTRNHWKIISRSIVSPLLPMQIVKFDTMQKDCYKNATRHRISYCIIEQWPIFLRRGQYK
jgi:hypothetical protein